VYTLETQVVNLFAWDGRAVGLYIKQKRERLGWSQRKLADRAGVSHAYVSHLEDGQYARPRIEKIKLVLGALGLTVEETREAVGRVNEASEEYVADGLDPELARIQVNLRTLSEWNEEVLREVGEYVQFRVEQLKKQRKEAKRAAQHQPEPPEEA
jgi:transcriptional regulator with XRE-family HTH domain